jgi:hypothetical protein
MNHTSAIEIRSSRRTYTDQPIASDKVKRLNEMIEQFNKEASLHLQLITNNGDAFSKFNKTYGLFKGVNNYITLIGKKDDHVFEKMGYYGEKLVLEATCMELGTCWVGGSFDRNACTVLEDEVLYGVIAIGNVAESKSFKEKTISKLAHRKTKSFEEFYESDLQVPEWFVNGIKAAQKAPSAMNGQPVKFYYQSGTVTAKVQDNLDFRNVDLGIAKYHFELGAGGGHWEYGNHGVFTK